MASELVDLEGELVPPYDTAKAYRFDYGGREPAWLPKSIVEWHPTPREGHRYLGTMVIPRWFAEKEGLV